MCDRICKTCGGDDQVAKIAEKMGFRPDIAFVRIKRLESLVRAVSCTDYDGIMCHDVDGKNWFDMRRELL